MATLVRQCSTYYYGSGTGTPQSGFDIRGWWDIYYEQTASDKALNRTKVTIKHILNAVGSFYGETFEIYGNFNGGGMISQGGKWITSSGWYTIKTTTHYVYHNTTTGKGSFTFQGGMGVSGYPNPFRYTNLEYISLPTIPKQSTVTATNANIGSASSINIKRASSAYTHKLYYKFIGQADYTLMAEGIETSYGWEVPTLAYALIPNNKEISCTIKCETYNGSTLVGNPTTTTMKAFVDEEASRPEITNLNGSTGLSNPLTGNPLAIIKYISSFSIWGDLSSKNSAKLKSISVTSGDGKSALIDLTTLDTDTHSLVYGDILLTLLESNVFTITLTDSRDISNVYNLPNDDLPTTLVPYVKLTLNPTFYRTSPTNGEIAVEFDGNYFNDSFGAVNNTLEVKYRYRELGEETWSEYYSLTPIIDDNKYSNGDNPIVLAQVFDYQKQYYFQFIAQDKIYTGNEIGGQTIVSRGIPNHWWNENTFNVEKDFVVQGQSHFNSGIYYGMNNYDVPHLGDDLGNGKRALYDNAGNPIIPTMADGTIYNDGIDLVAGGPAIKAGYKREGKDVYVKTMYIESFPNNNYVNVATGLTDKQRIVDVGGYASNGSSFRKIGAPDSIVVYSDFYENITIQTTLNRSAYSGYIDIYFINI